MCGRAYSPKFMWMWPNAQIGVMGGEQAAGVLVTITNDQKERLGQPPMTDEEVEFVKGSVIENAHKDGSAYYATSQLWDDGIIDPRKTREVLGLSLTAALAAPIEDTRFGVFRM